MIFDLLPEHLVLLRHMVVGWQDRETGAPEIQPKRPYGSSKVPLDMWRILYGETIDALDSQESAKLLALHRGTETALQIVLATGEFRAGRYEKSGPGHLGWRRVD